MYSNSWCSRWWSYLSFRGNSVQLRLCDNQFKVPFSAFLMRVLAQFVSCVPSKTNRWPEAQCWIHWMIYSLPVLGCLCVQYKGPSLFLLSLVICEPLFTRHEVITQRDCWELLRAALTHSETEVSVPVYRTKPLCNSWQSAEVLFGRNTLTCNHGDLTEKRVGANIFFCLSFLWRRSSYLWVFNICCLFLHHVPVMWRQVDCAVGVGPEMFNPRLHPRRDSTTANPTSWPAAASYHGWLDCPRQSAERRVPSISYSATCLFLLSCAGDFAVPACLMR